MDLYFPASFTSNTPHELQLLAMVENFSCQYSHLFPERKPLMLCPVNECGVKKFVSTTLRPTPSEHPELYTWEGCAAFVADYVVLEPLDPPYNLPPRLYSPNFVLKTQRATCFEYATLLCCLLLGADYDAYCVSGYAVRQMCQLDQSMKDCPLMYTKPQRFQFEQDQSPQSKYTVKPPRKQESQFVEQQEKTSEEEEEEKEPEEEFGEEELLQHKREVEEFGTQQPEDLLGIHCWILVLEGFRGVKHNFFIDPLTGMSYRTKSPSFLGIESVWNNYNCYINKQDCGQGCGDIVYDFEDIDLWEPVVHGAISKAQLMSNPEADEDSPYYNYKDEEIEEEEEEEEKDPLPFIMPKSWVSTITISKADLETRFPKAHKSVCYRKSKLQRYAPFLRTDGLVTRVLQYGDINCTEVTTVTELFENRRDHLEKRTINKVDGFTTDIFQPGRRFHLKLHRYQSLVIHCMHEMEFSEAARVDDMIKREVSPGALTEIFQNRGDFLYYRHVVFSRSVQFFENKNIEPSIYLQQVVERFNRNRTKPANEDVAERVFKTSEGCVEITFHLQKDRIIPSKMIYVKSADKRTGGQSQVLDPQRPRSPSKQEIALLVANEEHLFAQIKESMKEVRKMVLCRADEEKDVHLHFSPWTTRGAARARKEREEMQHHVTEEQRWLQRKEADIMAPLLIRLNNPKNLKPKEAKRLRQECISAYKQKLTEKENLIQERLQREKKDLQYKQDWYQQNQLRITVDEEESYHKYCSDKTLKIHVLQVRLNIHREEAPQRMQNFDNTLREDNRLSRLLFK